MSKGWKNRNQLDPIRHSMSAKGQKNKMFGGKVYKLSTVKYPAKTKDERFIEDLEYDCAKKIEIYFTDTSENEKITRYVDKIIGKVKTEEEYKDDFERRRKWELETYKRMYIMKNESDTEMFYTIYYDQRSYDIDMLEDSAKGLQKMDRDYKVSIVQDPTNRMLLKVTYYDKVTHKEPNKNRRGRVSLLNKEKLETPFERMYGRDAMGW